MNTKTEPTTRAALPEFLISLTPDSNHWRIYDTQRQKVVLDNFATAALAEEMVALLKQANRLREKNASELLLNAVLSGQPKRVECPKCGRALSYRETEQGFTHCRNTYRCETRHAITQVTDIQSLLNNCGVHLCHTHSKVSDDCYEAARMLTNVTKVLKSWLTPGPLLKK